MDFPAKEINRPGVALICSSLLEKLDLLDSARNVGALNPHLNSEQRSP